MRYAALATDYDGTLANRGRVDDAALDALNRLRASGRALILVTGRELDDLRGVFPRVDLFDRVVAENGAVLHRPRTGETVALAPPVPATLVEALQRQGVQPLSVGLVIVSTHTPHEKAVLDTIRELALDNTVVFNKGAVMILPDGVSKVTGLTAALKELDLDPREVVAVGDAENDHAFLRLCGLSVAVANALPSVKEECDLVTRGAATAGVIELIDRLIETDFVDHAPEPPEESETPLRPANH
ncbi:HAD family hydrolase [Azospirillum sp. sgz302134]